MEEGKAAVGPPFPTPLPRVRVHPAPSNLDAGAAGDAQLLQPLRLRCPLRFQCCSEGGVVAGHQVLQLVSQMAARPLPGCQVGRVPETLINAVACYSATVPSTRPAAVLPPPSGVAACQRPQCACPCFVPAVPPFTSGTFSRLSAPLRISQSRALVAILVRQCASSSCVGKHVDQAHAERQPCLILGCCMGRPGLSTCTQHVPAAVAVHHSHPQPPSRTP